MDIISENLYGYLTSLVLSKSYLEIYRYIDNGQPRKTYVCLRNCLSCEKRPFRNQLFCTQLTDY